MPYKHFTGKERGKLALFRRQKKTIHEIAMRLNRSPSSISRELQRNKDENQSYSADAAEKKYHKRRENSHRSKIYENDEVVKYVTEKLLLCWSPEQISGRLRFEKSTISVSFSSIYRWINEGLLPRAVEVKPNLRRFKKRKKAKARASRPDGRTIHQRAKNVLRRSRFGDWEVDTISFGCFPNQTYLLTANERKSRYTAIFLLKNIKRVEIMRGFEAILGNERLPLRTMTSDRGMEFNCHHEFEDRFRVPYYYADKGKPWQKPTIENTNGLLRQYLPKGTRIQEIPLERIAEIQASLNNRPRKNLGFRTPKEVLHLT